MQGTKVTVDGVEWSILERIGDNSGIAKVYKAENRDGDVLAAKFVPKDPTAEREYKFEQPKGALNVVPVLHTKETDSHYILFMPLAEKSLRKHISDANDLLSPEEGLNVLIDVAEALSSIAGKVVHRDIKPENVLLLDGKWCIADFGIAKYAESATEPATNKFRLTPPYASPEQWRMARADSPADIYAYGVMAFEILEGRRPFVGPDLSDYQEQHLTQEPPKLVRTKEPIASLILSCMFKSSPGRPIASQILVGLRGSDRAMSEGDQRLLAAKAKLVEEESARQAHVSASAIESELREQLTKDGMAVMQPIVERLTKKIVAVLPEVTTIPSPGLLHLTLGDIALRMDTVKTYPPGILQGRGHRPRFDVVIATSIGVQKPADLHGYEGRAHSLWYCDAQQEGVYRWYELGFGISALTGRRATLIPLDLDPDNDDAVLALSNTAHTFELTRKPGPIDQGEAEEFIDRWAGYFADAYVGNLSAPNAPENPTGFFR